MWKRLAEALACLCAAAAAYLCRSAGVASVVLTTAAGDAGEGETMPPPEPANSHACPVCGYRPCAEDCRLGLNEYDLEKFENEFVPPWERDDED